MAAAVARKILVEVGVVGPWTLVVEAVELWILGVASGGPGNPAAASAAAQWSPVEVDLGGQKIPAYLACLVPAVGLWSPVVAAAVAGWILAGVQSWIPAGPCFVALWILAEADSLEQSTLGVADCAALWILVAADSLEQWTLGVADSGVLSILAVANCVVLWILVVASSLVLWILAVANCGVRWILVVEDSAVQWSQRVAQEDPVEIWSPGVEGSVGPGSLVAQSSGTACSAATLNPWATVHLHGDTSF